MPLRTKSEGFEELLSHEPLDEIEDVFCLDFTVEYNFMGEKIVFTELIAFGDLQSMISKNQLSERSAIIASYALCGFANFGSIGIQLGGIGGIAPQRKKELAKLITKAMIGGALASWLTASVAGILI